MNYASHIVRNFPRVYPWWKKVIANLMFLFGRMIIHRRKNLLSKNDIAQAKERLQVGDVILVGGLRRLSSVFIGGPVTHTLLYIGKKRVVHSIADGVEYASMRDIFREYDTMVILRPKKISKTKLKKLVSCAKAQVGKPYDFDFSDDGKKLYCSELVEFASNKAGLDCGTESQMKKNNQRVVRPIHFINKKFKVVMLSHNLRLVNGILIRT